MSGERTRRPHAPGGRPHDVLLSYSDQEWVAITVAAARAGMATGAWIASAALQVAEGRTPAGSSAAWGQKMRQLMAATDDLADARRLLRNMGGLLNQVARVANSTGEVAQHTGRAIERVGQAVARVDRAAAAVVRVLGHARQRRQGKRPPPGRRVS